MSEIKPYRVKTYIVQRLDGEVIAAKLTFEAAHAVAKTEAPARVLFSLADKSDARNVAVHSSDRSDCN